MADIGIWHSSIEIVRQIEQRYIRRCQALRTYTYIYIIYRWYNDYCNTYDLKRMRTVVIDARKF
jgi:hypothetical protein